MVPSRELFFPCRIAEFRPHLRTLCQSVCKAAGLGNLVSDLAGVVLAGYVEAFAEKLGIPAPNLSLEQYDMKSAKISAAMGRCIGIALGCLLGMLPLLFLNTEPKVELPHDEAKS